MDVTTFWNFIDKARDESGGDTSKQAELLVNSLASLSLEEIFAFERIWDDVMDFAYDAALWDAAYIIGCGCGDDGFWDFRAWLIAQGKQTYEEALANPESLVDLIKIDKDAQEGALIYVVMKAYEQKMGEEIPIRESKVNRPLAQLKGTHWGIDRVEARFPKLTAKFGDCDKRFYMML
jgi:hypothetical protein